MHKCFKYLTFILTFAITLITCSGCFEDTVGEATKPLPKVNLTTSPASITYREMSEELYIGYLGAQRDFALVIDNLQYNYDNNKGGCQTDDKVGCASAMGQLLIQFGLQANKFTNIPGDKNLLIYYVSASEFVNFGGGDESWLTYLSPSKGYKSTDNKDQGSIDDFNKSENVLKNTCGSGSGAKICEYARDIATKGYSADVGNSLLLLFHAGDFSGMISDKQLDPHGNLDTSVDYDNVIVDNNPNTQLYQSYYDALLRALKEKVNVSYTTADSDKKATKQSIRQIDTIEDLINLVEGKGGYSEVTDFLLLITTEGFLEQKIGNNQNYATVNDAMEGKPLKQENAGLDGKINQAINNIMLLFNTASSYNDNCALESSKFQTFLAKALETLLAVGAGAAIGAAIGTAIFPGIGTLVGGIIGGLIGLFANNAVSDMLKDANGITGDKYCKIMLAALSDFEINVPVYSYKISSFGDYRPKAGDPSYVVEGNLSKYKKGELDPQLAAYYDSNQRRCLTQNVKVGVAQGLASILIGNLATEYNYADKCEAELVRGIVGGFVGSPSLLMFIDHKQVDDLHGRATTQLIREMLFSWGLTQIGSVYTLLTNSNLSTLNITLSAAQKINNLRYCVSESSLPSCDDKMVTTVSYDNSGDRPGYVGAMDPSKGINIDLKNAYIEASKNIIKNNQSDYNFTIKELEAYNKKPSSGGWHLISTVGEMGEELTIATLQQQVNTTFSSNVGEWYSVEHSSVHDGENVTITYLISDNAVIGYISKKIDSTVENYVVYYWNGTNEYVFSETELPGDYIDQNYLTVEAMKNKSDISISSSHEDLYIYIVYETAADQKTNVFTYNF